MVQRLTYRRRHSYATKSNKVRKVKTPGGVLTLHNVRKKASGIKSGDCGKVLQGVRHQNTNIHILTTHTNYTGAAWCVCVVGAAPLCLFSPFPPFRNPSPYFLRIVGWSVLLVSYNMVNG